MKSWADLVQSIPEIIKQSSTPLGIVALVCICTGVLAMFFFKAASTKTKLFVFVLCILFFLVAEFGAVATIYFKVAPQPIPENYATEGPPIATQPEITTNTPPAQPKVEIVTFNQDVPFFGGWKNTAGDRNLDTNFRDRVPVTATTTLTNDSKRVWLIVSFSCKEDGGDHTAFSGTQKKLLFEAKGDRSIAAVHFPGKSTVTFADTSVGKNHSWTSFPAARVNGTYWNRFGYRIDTAYSDDSKYVGVMGRLSFTIELK